MTLVDGQTNVKLSIENVTSHLLLSAVFCVFERHIYEAFIWPNGICASHLFITILTHMSYRKNMKITCINNS